MRPAQPWVVTGFDKGPRRSNDVGNMNSMTGYGRGRAAGVGHEVVVELSSVNRKTLEVTVSSPREYTAAERWVVEGLRGQLERGKVHATVTVRTLGAAAAPDWDAVAVRGALARLRELALAEGIPFQPDARLLAQLSLGLRSTGSSEPDPEVADLVTQALAEAVAALQEMRGREGAALAADVRQRVAAIATWVAEVQELLPGAAVSYRESLLARLRQAGLDIDLSDERLLKELALWADRADVTEELVRLASHRQQIDNLLAETGAVGRRLEFLLQEVQREINTLGAKSSPVEITKRIMLCKNEVEKLREQAANIE